MSAGRVRAATASGQRSANAGRPPLRTPAPRPRASRASRASQAAPGPTPRAVRPRPHVRATSSPATGTGAVRRARRSRARARRPRSASRGQPRRPSGRADSSSEDEPDAADGLDERRFAELPAQVRDVAVDDVRLGVAPPDNGERLLPRDDMTGVAEQQRKEVGLAPTELEPPVAARDDARVERERDVSVAED